MNSGLSQTFSQLAMETDEWPYTDECFADTRSAQGAFDQIKNPETGLVDAECFVSLYWAVETGEWGYFNEDGGEPDDDGDADGDGDGDADGDGDGDGGDDDTTPVDVCAFETAASFMTQYADVADGTVDGVTAAYMT
jgi:hypothetical protein